MGVAVAGDYSTADVEHTHLRPVAGDGTAAQLVAGDRSYGGSTEAATLPPRTGFGVWRVYKITEQPSNLADLSLPVRQQFARQAAGFIVPLEADAGGASEVRGGDFHGYTYIKDLKKRTIYEGDARHVLEASQSPARPQLQKHGAHGRFQVDVDVREMGVAKQDREATLRKGANYHVFEGAWYADRLVSAKNFPHTKAGRGTGVVSFPLSLNSGAYDFDGVSTRHERGHGLQINIELVDFDADDVPVLFYFGPNIRTVVNGRGEFAFSSHFDFNYSIF